MGWLSRLSLQSGFACWVFPARRNEFPVPDHRESVATTAERLRNLGTESVRRVQFRTISLHFPCRSGKASRDEFAPDCLHRHLVCGCRDFPIVLRHDLRNLRDSAGSWPSDPGGVSEPETAGSGAGMRCGPCSSLLATRAVRIRSPFAPRAGREVIRLLVRRARSAGECAA
jgi:hypothetical protein